MMNNMIESRSICNPTKHAIYMTTITVDKHHKNSIRVKIQLQMLYIQ